MRDQLPVGFVGMVGEPGDGESGVLPMQGLSTPDPLAEAEHVPQHAIVETAMPGTAGIAAGCHQARFAGEVAFGGADEPRQLTEPMSASRCRQEGTGIRYDASVLAVDEPMTEDRDGLVGHAGSR